MINENDPGTVARGRGSEHESEVKLKDFTSLKNTRNALSNFPYIPILLGVLFVIGVPIPATRGV